MSTRGSCVASITIRTRRLSSSPPSLELKARLWAGGRYDGLVEMMGGPAMPGVGWAAGIERLAMLIADPPAPPRPVAIVPIGEAGGSIALVIAEVLRDHGWVVDLGYSGNLSRRMRRASRLNARAAVLIGDDEAARNVVRLRDLDTGEQSDVPARLPADPAVPMDQRLVELRSRLQAIGT